jgi:hypothetical protein
MAPGTSGAVARSALPELVRAYAERVGVSEPSAARTVRLGQVGEMLLKQGAKRLAFTAVEDLAVASVAFAWRARFPMLGPLALRVTDAYDRTQGRLDVRLLGLPLQRNRGPELAQAEALRYLAEIAWVPQAIHTNPHLEWRELDYRTVELGTRVQGNRIAVRLIFNEVGEIAQAVAERPRLEAGNALTPWIGVYSDYQQLGGVRLPTRAEVSYELPDGPFTYWRGRVTSLELRDQGQAPPLG